MTLQEAINSGKRFTRPALETYGYIESDSLSDVPLSKEDILATDYFVEETLQISLSLNEFKAAWDVVASDSATVKPSSSSPLFAKLAAKLFNS